jgi:CheY-like chemotaxis protein
MLMNSSEYGVYAGLDNIGKEYIAKCLGISKISEQFIKSTADNIFIIKSTLNIMKPELEFFEDKEKLKEINSYIQVIKDKAGDILRIAKETRIKLLHISQIKFSSKTDLSTREKHTATYKNFYNTMMDLIDNFLRDIVDMIFNSIKEVQKLTTIKSTKEDFYKWHVIMFRNLKESLRYLKVAITNSNVIKKHVDEYRKNLINQIKVHQILDEVKRVRPIALMRSAGRVKVDELTPGSIFSHSLFTDDSTLVKQAYDPFTEANIKELKASNVQYLYKHNNLDKNLKPSDYHIAVVDDDKAFTDLVSEQLEDLQFNVDVYNNAEKALREIVTSVPDIVLLDIRMPGVNGLNFLKAIYNPKNKDIKITIPVIMSTVIADERLIRECIKLGAYDYIVKPFSIEDLLVKITTYLHIKSQNLEDANTKDK